MKAPWEGILCWWCGIMIPVGYVLEFCTWYKITHFTFWILCILSSTLLLQYITYREYSKHYKLDKLQKNFCQIHNFYRWSGTADHDHQSPRTINKHLDSRCTCKTSIPRHLAFLPRSQKVIFQIKKRDHTTIQGTHFCSQTQTETSGFVAKVSFTLFSMRLSRNSILIRTIYLTIIFRTARRSKVAQKDSILALFG